MRPYYFVIFLFAAFLANLALWGALIWQSSAPFSWTARESLFALAGMALSAAMIVALFVKRLVEMRDGLEPQWAEGTGTGTGAPVKRSATGWLTALGIAIAGGLLLAGVLTDDAKPVPAALILLLGAGALFTIIAAAERLIAGSEVEVSSHWGGLGGSLGGWRISQTAILLLLALILVSATVMAGNALTAAETNKSVEANESGTADSDATGESSEANEAGAGSNAAANEQGNVTSNESAANVAEVPG
jgi:hypothetical protein